MGISSKSNTSSRYQVRSISFPCRSHPSTIRIEQELNNLKTWEAASLVPTEGSIYEGLKGLALLYTCVNDHLNLPLTQQALSCHRNEKWVDELLEGSVRLLDVCGLSKDMVSQIGDHVRDIQCALRRRKGDSSMVSSIAKYASLRRKIKKEAKRLDADVKQINDRNTRNSLVLELDQHIVMVIKVLMEVSEMTTSIFESLLSFLSIKPRPCRWSIVAKLMQKGRVSYEEYQGSVNELESLDVALFNLLCEDGSRNEGEKMQIAQNRLEAMEAHIEGMDGCLGCIFRGLIRTRSLLLNIVSQ